MRTAVVCGVAMIFVGAACATVPIAGALGEGSSHLPRITGVDTAHPPRGVSVQLDENAYVAVLLVASGHSATLLFPRDSVTDNQRPAGAHFFAFEIPEVLVPSDSQRARALLGQRDTSRANVARARAQRPRTVAPLLPTTPTYLLVVTSPQALSYQRIVEKTAGVSIPVDDLESLNAVGKAVKSTIPAEPRTWAGYYQPVALRRPS